MAMTVLMCIITLKSNTQEKNLLISWNLEEAKPLFYGN